MNLIIKKLQDKKFVRPFGLMEEILPGSHEAYQKAKPINCLVYMSNGAWPTSRPDGFNDTLTYAIKPNYQPGSEYIDLEIKVVDGWLRVNQKDNALPEPHGSLAIHYLPCLPNFECFWYNFEGVEIEGITLTIVSKTIDEGKTVYARLRSSNES